MTTLVIEFKKSVKKTKTITNESDIEDAFESIYTTIISYIQKYLGKSSDWIIDSVVSHTMKNFNVQSLSWW